MSVAPGVSSSSPPAPLHDANIDIPPSDSAGSIGTSTLMNSQGGVVTSMLVAVARRVLSFFSIIVLFYSAVAIWKMYQHADVSSDVPLKLWLALFAMSEVIRLMLSSLRSYYAHLVYNGMRREQIWWRRLLQPLGLIVELGRGGVWALGYLWLFSTNASHGEEGTKDLLFWCRICWSISTVLLFLPLVTVVLLLMLLPCLFVLLPFFLERSPNETSTEEPLLERLERKTYEEVVRGLRSPRATHSSRTQTQQHQQGGDTSILPLLSNQASGQGAEMSSIPGRDQSQVPRLSSDSAAHQNGSSSEERNGALSSLFLHTDCRICLSAFSPDDEVVCLPCDRRHFFHSSCVLKWLRMSQLCPVCRRNIVEIVQQKDNVEAMQEGGEATEQQDGAATGASPTSTSHQV